jgi:hypothetical protein
MRAMIAAAAFVAAMGFNIPAGYAFGDAPWCAVKNFGSDVVWDCQYRTVEECVPHVIAGDAGAAPGSSQAPGGPLISQIAIVKFALRNLPLTKHIADCKRRVNATV